MFTSDDPRCQQLLELADLAAGNGLMDFQRPIWRDLVTQLLGSIRDPSPGAERRKDLRAPLELEVDIVAPDELASLATSSIGAGGRPRLASSVTNISPGLASRTFTCAEGGTTSGRWVRVCGQMGVSRIASCVGRMMGPAALNEYAVEPVGVATMRPSAS